jgi:EAL domain-containing protein (putative c-di-GMP-specific phosphodiesterase class I)
MRSRPPDDAVSDPSRPVGNETSQRWFLESWAAGGKGMRRVPIRPIPFRIGRRQGLDLTLPSDSVSKEHAEIYLDIDTLRVRDLGSTNGTFVNLGLVTDSELQQGDILHFADFEFRVAVEQVASSAAEGNDLSTVSLKAGNLSQQFVQGTRELSELLRGASVTVALQPIVTLSDGTIMGYEVLGRGRHPGLSSSPLDLFRIAKTMGASAELSRLFRRRAVEVLAHRTDIPVLFVNAHESELPEPGLVESMAELAAAVPRTKLVLEIHEDALRDLEVIRSLHAALGDIGAGLAYDDFGIGEARLLELGEVPPDFLKFDREFIHAIDHAKASKQRVLTSLVEVARDLEVKTVAEGIETGAEAEVCVRLGFTHAQGFYFGPPAPAERP